METAEKPEEKRVKMPYKLIDREYYAGDLWDFIEGRKADAADPSKFAIKVDDTDPSKPVIVVGLDFGHGECMAYKRYKVGTTWLTVSLHFDDDQGQKLMTVIRYGDDGTVTIGKEVATPDAAARGGHIYPYFKEPPTRWEQPSQLRDSANNAITFGKVIRDFLRALWDRILENDQVDTTPSIREAAKDGRLLVAMGCPASSEWTKQESINKLYELLRDITGCDNVAIMPEPKAALMAPIVYSKNISSDWKARLTALMSTGKGICIYDLGSSTIDFTYVRLGEILITRSIRLGGSDLDSEMLKKAEQKTGLNLGGDGKNATWSIRDENKLSLREAKEKYYSSGGAMTPAVLNPVNGANIKSFLLDPDFMRSVVGTDSDKDSWYQRVHKFFESTQVEVMTYLGGKAEDFNGLIILTGGTSHVTEVRDICANVWMAVEENPFKGGTSGPKTDDGPNRAGGHARFTVLKDPSSSVATGLAFAKSTEYAAADKFPALRESLNASYQKAYDSFVDNLASYCATVVLKFFQQAVEFYNDGQSHKIDEIVNKASELIRNSGNFSDEHMKQSMDFFLGINKKDSAFNQCKQQILEKVNAFSGEIYGGQLNEGIKLSNMTIGEDVRFFMSNAVTNALLDKIKTTVLRSTFKFLFSLDLAKKFLRFLTSSNYLINWSDNPTFVDRRAVEPLTPKQIQKIALKLDRKHQQILNSAFRDAEKRLTYMDSKDMKDPYYQMLDAQLEVAIGKILFLVYDRSNCK